MMRNNLLFLLILSTCLSENVSSLYSYKQLIKNNKNIHPTFHITNIIRNGAESLNERQKKDLEELGLVFKGSKVIVQKPDYLDQTYETEHYRFHFTLDSTSINKVESFDYIIQMGEIFEQVWLFFMDTLDFDPPVSDPMENNDLYNIYVENLPSYYFGITYTSNYNELPQFCSSFIKMRNSYSASQFNIHTEIENIKVTAVHEFFHSIQFSYNCFERLWLMEATAVWSEDQLFNNINDLYRYLGSWFSNCNFKSINDESNHMYGSFIYFQYLDEHLGGPEIIKNIWDHSKDNSSSTRDISFESIDNILKENNNSLDQTFHNMAIANKILDERAPAPFFYQEAEGYKSVATDKLVEPEIVYLKDDHIILDEMSMNQFTTVYFKLLSNDPVKVLLNSLDRDFKLSVVIKHNNIDRWTVKSGREINIDPRLNYDWISIVVSAIGIDNNNWDFSLEFQNGYFEDFSLAQPYPNPSFNQTVHLLIDTVDEQNVSITVNDILGRIIWEKEEFINNQSSKLITWNGKNLNGKKVSNGIYFMTAQNLKKSQTYKIVFLKN